MKSFGITFFILAAAFIAISIIEAEINELVDSILE